MKYKVTAAISLIITLTLATPTLLAQSTFSGERLTAGCVDFVKSFTGMDADVSVTRRIGNFSFDETGVTARFVAHRELRGASELFIEFVFDGKVIETVKVPISIKIYKSIPVAKNNLRANVPLRDMDITFERREISHINENDIPDFNEIPGTVLERSVSKGTAITRKLLAQQKIIKHGDAVTIVVISGGVRVRTTGTALQDAAAGESVRVKRDGTPTVLVGRAAMDGSVLISADRASND